jgi:hypothetical protein
MNRTLTASDGQTKRPKKGENARHRDKAAAELIRRMRVNEGLGYPELARAIRDKGVAAGYDAARVSVSADTLYLVESTHREPGPRIKFAISFYFDLRPGQVWKRDALGQLPNEVRA